MTAYYNEIDPYAAQWLRNLIKAGHIADGEVDTRSIIDVRPDDLREFTQCHFFAGIAGWSYALRLAGWPDDRQIWTGSCPCQPFSVAGQGKGFDDDRHLWPDFFRLIRSCRPQVIMGEQVAGTAGYSWLDGVRSDLEGEDYSCEGVDIPACSANAPHIRQRLFWISVDNAKSVGQEHREPRCRNEGANEIHQRRQEEIGAGCSLRNMANSESNRREHGIFKSTDGHEGNEPPWSGRQFADNSISNMANSESGRWRVQQPKNNWQASRKINASSDNSASNDGSAHYDGHWSNAVWVNGADGKKRRTQPGICLLADGIPARVGKLRAYGNAIVPQIAAEVISSFMDTEGS